MRNNIKHAITALKFTGGNTFEITRKEEKFVITGKKPFKVIINGTRTATFETENDYNCFNVGGNIFTSFVGGFFSSGNVNVIGNNSCIGAMINDGRGDIGNEITYHGVRYIKGPISNNCPLVVNGYYYYTTGSQILNTATASETNPEIKDGYCLEWIFEKDPQVCDIDMEGATELTTNESGIFDSKLRVETSGASKLNCNISSKSIDTVFNSSGASGVVFNALFGKIRVNTSGSSNVTLSSNQTVSELEIESSGASRVDTQFVSNMVHASTSGASSIRGLQIEKSGKLRSSGASNISGSKLSGANVDKSTTGASSVNVW